MPPIRTDDAPRALRGVWLGWAGFTLPFEWTYLRWGITIAAAFVSLPLFGLALWVTTGAWLFALAGGTVCAIGTGILLGDLLSRGASFDEPFGYRAGVLAEGWRAFRRGSTRAVRLAAVAPAAGDLGPGARRSMGWGR